MRHAVLAALFATTLLVPVATFAATPKPAFFDNIKSQQDMDNLTEEQKAELRAYLTAAAFEAPGAVMDVDSMDASIDKGSYSVGDPVVIGLTWASDMAKGYVEQHPGKTADIPKMSATVSLIDAEGNPCIDPIETTVPVTDMNPVFSAKATADCGKPSVVVSLVDWEGKNVGKWTVGSPTVTAIESKAQSSQETGSSSEGTSSVGSESSWKNIAKTVLYVLIPALLVIGAGIVALRSVRKRNGK